MRKHLFQLLYAPDGAPSGGGTAVAEGSGATPPASGSPEPGSGGAPGAPSPTGQTPPTPTFSFPEDRKDWIPPYRFKQIGETIEDLKRQLQVQTGRVRALAGFGPDSQPQDPREAALKEAIQNALPEELRELMEWAKAGGHKAASSVEDAHWRRQAQQYGRELVQTYAKAINVDPATLPPKTMGRMANLFQAFIAEDRTGERTWRYEAADPDLLTEFVQEITGIFIEPQRRAATTTAATTVETNRNLPRVGPRGGVPPATPPAKLKGAELRQAARAFVRKSTGQE